MKYLIFNEYINQNMKNLDLRNNKLETIQIRTNDYTYGLGDYVEVDFINGKPSIGCKIEKPLDFLDYFNKGKLSRTQLVSELSDYVGEIKNEKYKIILQELVFASEDFFIFPAAKSIHHAYVGGLCTHTLSMLELAQPFISKYDLDKDLLYAGIMLHDYGKVRELMEYGISYTIEGNLLGHISMCYEEVANVAINLGFNNEPEITALKHLILSHHGRLDYGSPKEPMLREAYVLSMIDELDAKMDLLNNVYAKMESNTMSAPVLAFDRRRFIKL